MTYFEKILKKYLESKHGIREPKLPDVIEYNAPTVSKQGDFSPMFKAW